jgi:hypothetical protein
MTTSKSPIAVARVAYEAAKKSLPAYTHLCSPHKFTQHQLAACLVLKEFFNTDYRGIVAILEDSTDIKDILELTVVPHFTTLQKSAKQLLKKKNMDKLLSSILSMAKKGKIIKNKVSLAAIDGTGFESHHISSYFVKRKSKGRKEYQMTTYTRYPKVGIICDTSNHLVLCGVPTRGPGPDILHYFKAIDEVVKQKKIDTLVADAGYDSERSHVVAREGYGIKTMIPPLIGRQTDKLPKGRYRRLMATKFDRKLYGQRWQVETVNSMIKRNLGSHLRARSYWNQCKELMLKIFTHNVMVVWIAG